MENNLSKFFEVVTALRSQYLEENHPNKDLKIKILSQVLADFFVYGKIPHSFRVQYPMPINGTLIIDTVKELFEALSIELKLIQVSKKFTSAGSMFYAVFTTKEK